MYTCSVLSNCSFHSVLKNFQLVLLLCKEPHETLSLGCSHHLPAVTLVTSGHPTHTGYQLPGIRPFKYTEGEVATNWELGGFRDQPSLMILRLILKNWSSAATLDLQETLMQDVLLCSWLISLLSPVFRLFKSSYSCKDLSIIQVFSIGIESTMMALGQPLNAF